MENDEQISPNKNTIQMDTCKIDMALSSSAKAYNEPDLADIFLYNPTNDSSVIPSNANPNSKYLGNIHNKFNYIGILSDKLTREVCGLNKYENGDWYIGMWEKDIKHGIGIYSYKTQSSDEEEYYIGEWSEGKKEGKGIYIWKHSSFDSQNINDTPNGYNAIVGSFLNDSFVKGLTIRKGDNCEVVYEGKYNDNKMKNDDDCVMVENRNQLFYGEYKEDVMESGTIVTFKEETGIDIDKCFAFKINENNNPADNNEISYEYELLKDDVRKQKENKGIGIRKRMQELKVFEMVNNLFSDGILLLPHFSDLVKLQVVSFDMFFKNIKNYLANEFTLKTL